ncbi:hypothetical protein [Bradyrhizobium sp. 62]|uniref:hypothetical protein n=1 Tax=Bradyrhizobium sp. 62 TaxID=1043588 RepID=UPI001FF78B79|nr:hypothetical protein [Bradyrhizobium sp. 62]MCK1368460.1 hypothetical protein [Bradyrhizobium sp. 62]
MIAIIILLDDVAEMDSDTKLDASIWRQAGGPLDHAIPHLDRHADRSSVRGQVTTCDLALLLTQPRPKAFRYTQTVSIAEADCVLGLPV